MKKKIIIISAVAAVVAVIAVAVSLVLFTAKPQEEVTTTAPITTTEPAPDTSHINKLTGLETLSDKAVGKRPVAIMINNIKAALPQYGIYKADIMYEIPVEGGITRMMAIYGDYSKVPNVCSVRSCRYYFPIFAHGYDAVYFCFGINESLARPTVEKIGIDWLNGNDKYDTSIFGRDSERAKKYSKEHTAYVKGSAIPETLKKYDIRSNYKDNKNKEIFNFRDEGVSKKAGSIDCKELRLDFSHSYYSTFTYNSKTKTYYKTHCGNKHMDSKAEKQLNYKNVFVLETEVKLHTDGYLMKVDWKGGTGYYVSDGGAQKITWTKENAASNIKIFNENGKQIKVNRGNSYIGVIGTGNTKITGAEKK